MGVGGICFHGDLRAREEWLKARGGNWKIFLCPGDRPRCSTLDLSHTLKGPLDFEGPSLLVSVGCAVEPLLCEPRMVGDCPVGVSGREDGLEPHASSGSHTPVVAGRGRVGLAPAQEAWQTARVAGRGPGVRWEEGSLASWGFALNGLPPPPPGAPSSLGWTDRILWGVLSYLFKITIFNCSKIHRT